MNENLGIFNYFKDLKLTSDQKSALVKLDDFINSNKQIFILKGYAGTGKTTILKGIAKYLQTTNRLGHIMAPTGRAAMVIKLKTKYLASTIHKSLYDFERLKTEKNIDRDGNETFKFYFDFVLDAMDVNKVSIFDEASMISNVFSEGEFFRFGTGYLLNDILQHFNPNNTTNTKLIFVGDPAQIPPVGSKNSLALNTAFFKGKQLLVDEVEMTKVVRQEEGCGILENAAYYRGLIFNDIVSENIFKIDFDDVEEIIVENVASIFTKISPIPNSKDCIIITHSNALAKIYNQIIREVYFPDCNSIQAGDILQIVKNNYSNQQVELLNGDFVKVLSISEEVTYQSARIKKLNSDDVLIKHVFRKLQILHISGEVLDVQILDSFLNSKNRSLTSDETKALYINFIMRYKERIGGTINRKSKEFKEAFKNDPFYNALQVKYGYAITGHKSQGGEWKNVIVDFKGRIGTSKDALRWNYTALTRASEKLYVINPPKLKQVDFSKIKDISIGKLGKIPKNVLTFENVELTPYHTIDSHPCKRIKYYDVIEILEENGFELYNLISNQYLEKYTIKTKETLFTIDMYHNGDGVFTKYLSIEDTEDSKTIIPLLSAFKLQKFNFGYSTNIKLLEKIYQTILDLMDGLEIQLIKIDDSKYAEFHVDYYFQTKAQVAYFQIYFNKNDIVTSVIAKSMLGADDTILAELIGKFKKNI